jgi:hypothetical protein
MQITVYSEKHRGVWSRFVDASANGTLFHRQEFLDYHPPGRFLWHHLIFGDAGEPLAVLPGAIHIDAAGHNVFRSPTGATLGGFAVRPRLGLSRTVELIQSLADYGREQGFAALTVGTVPRIYWPIPDDTLDFALRDAGFTCTPQLMFYVPLRLEGSSDIMQLIPGGKRWDFRKALQQGLDFQRADGEADIAAFYDVLSLNKAAHGASAVHSLEEILRLKQMLGERVRIRCAVKDGVTVAGVYSVAATPRVSYTQYIADRPDCRGLEATRFVLLHLLQELVDGRVDCLDLGPSVQLPINRRGGALFKESVGGYGCERCEWTLALSKTPGELQDPSC